jgi:hypothetical protein
MLHSDVDPDTLFLTFIKLSTPIKIRGYNMISFVRGLRLLFFYILAIGILLLAANPIEAQFDRNWKREIDWAGWIYAGISRCSSNNSEYRFYMDKLAESVGAYMKYHTVASESIDYYPVAIKASMIDINAKGVDCRKVYSELERFRRKHGTYAAPR